MANGKGEGYMNSLETEREGKPVNDAENLVIDTVYRNPNKITKEYKIWMDHIGKGAFGEVRKALHLESGEFRAVKIIYKHECEVEEQNKIIREVDILRKLDHPNIIKIYEFFEDSKFMYIIMELAQDGELFDKIENVHHFSERKAAEIFLQILSGVNYLHKNNIVHRDLKPENILFDNEILKIVDFGTSKVYTQKKKMNECHGTPYYIAPEVLNESYDEKCDVWSCGVILYILLSGMPPFNGKDDDEILNAVMKGKYTLDISEFRKVSNQAKNFIKKLLTYNPKDRITIQQAIDDEWFSIVKTKEEVVLNGSVLNNLKTFNTKNKMQQSIYFFLVNHMASKEEKKELTKTFKALDINNDGVLSKDELLAGFKRINTNMTENDINEIIDRIDNNKSKEIDYSEFIAAAINRKNLLSEEKMQTCFNIFDKDKSGKISVTELKEMLQGNNVVEDNVWQDLMQQADRNGDGELEYEEFKELLMKMIN